MGYNFALFCVQIFIDSLMEPEPNIRVELNSDNQTSAFQVVSELMILAGEVAGLFGKNFSAKLIQILIILLYINLIRNLVVLTMIIKSKISHRSYSIKS